MQKATNYIKFFLLIASLLLSSCLSRFEDHGYIFEGIAKNDVKIDISDKREILMLMGSPTVMIYGENSENWIYLSENVKELLFFKPKIVKREVFVVKFAKNDRVSEFESYSLDNQREFNFDQSITAVSSTKKGFFESIFSNIGQITPE